MKYEVEMKFQIEARDVFFKTLEHWNIVLGEAVVESDCFYSHPLRDFAETDECLRIREKNNCFLITYKGPKIDTTTKTRREIELPLDCSSVSIESWNELLVALGFQQSGVVRKTRRSGTVFFEGQSIEILLDHLDEIGDYVELEMVADEKSLESSRETLIAFSEKMGLTKNIRDSYLELILKSRDRRRQKNMGAPTIGG